jgi:mono/diheme cytochrome c family protein
MTNRIAAALGIAALFAACSAARHGSVGTSADATARGRQPTAAERGAPLYAAYCAGCHGPQGRGDGPVAGVIKLKPADLRAPGLLDRASDDALVARLLHGSPLPSTPRRNAVAEDLEADALLAYLPTLSTSNWDVLRVGRLVFEGTCASCHGAYGEGEGALGATNDPPPPSLLRARERYSDPGLAQLVTYGHGSMLPLGAVFQPGEVPAVVAYVRHLSKGYRLYDTYCASCHGDDGHGVHPEDLLPPAMKAPELGAVTLDRLGPKAARAKVLHMVRRESGRMPHFRDTLSEAQLRDVIAYLRRTQP